MVTASNPSNVVEALAAVMAELPAIGKDGKASAQQGGYSYRGIESITKEAQALFAKFGVVYVPSVRHQEIRDIVVNGKPWTDTILNVDYFIFGPGGKDDYILASVVGIGRDNSDKGANKAMTQAFKYALIQTLCISDAKDDGDHGAPEADTRAPAQPAPVTDPEALRLREVVAAALDAGVVTKEQVGEAAAKHGVTRDGWATTSAEVLASVLDTLGISDGEKVLL